MALSLGTWRFFLSFLVVISHLYKDMFGGPAAYAVWGFFVLSGFLMTEILRHRYGFTKHGLYNYAFNRGLRILPAYWLAMILGAITIWTLTSNNISISTILNPSFSFPQNFASWFANLTLMPFSYVSGRLVPVSGALAVEVGVYILIPLMAFSRTSTWLGLILSFFVSIQYGFDISTFPERYSFLLPAFFAFAVGSLISHYKDELQNFKAPILSLAVWILHCFVIIVMSTWPWTYGLYLSAFLSAWVVISYADVKGNKLDVLLGDLSYPVYLFHTIVAAWLLFFFEHDKSFSFFLVSFLLTLVVSWLVLKLVDIPLHRFKVSSKSEAIGIKIDNSFFIKMLRKSLDKFAVVSLKVKNHSNAILIWIAILISLLVLWQGYKILTNDTLIVKDYNPKIVKAQTIPNIQANGNAAIWIKTSMTYGLGELRILIDNQPVKMTNITRKTLTTSISPEFFKNKGKLDLVIEQVNTGKKFKVGTIIIND